MNLATAFICGLLAAMPSPILDTWVGKHYDGAAYLMIVFAISSQVNLMTGPGTSILKGIGLPNEEFYYCLPNVLALLIALPASRLIQGQWTATGIATAVVASTVVSAAYFIRRANRLMDVSPRQYWKSVLFPGLVPYLVAAPFSLPAFYVLAHASRWVTAGCVAAMAAIYSLALILVIDRFVLDSGERLWFRAVISSRLRKSRARTALAGAGG